MVISPIQIPLPINGTTANSVACFDYKLNHESNIISFFPQLNVITYSLLLEAHQKTYLYFGAVISRFGTIIMSQPGERPSHPTEWMHQKARTGALVGKKFNQCKAKN